MPTVRVCRAVMGCWLKLVRETYFTWSEERLASLEALKAEGLTWPQVAGRMTVAYDQEVTAEGCRNAWRRLGKRGSLARPDSFPRICRGLCLNLSGAPLWA